MGKRWLSLARAYALASALSTAACDSPDAPEAESGAGGGVAVTTQALSAPPDSACTVATFQGHEYWFCTASKSWSAARTQCQTEGLDLARVDSAEENAFITANLVIDAWIGAQDPTEGNWRWVDNGVQFWSGGAFGGPVGGRYANWDLWQPDNWLNQDCGAMETFSLGSWGDRACSETLDFVCERALAPGEPSVDCSLDPSLSDAPWPQFRRCLSGQARSAVLGPEDADTVTSFTSGGEIESSPAIAADGTIYFGSFDGGLYALHPDLTLAWKFQTSGAVRSSPAIGSDGTIYVGSNDGRVRAIHPDGTLRWSYLTGGPVRSSPAVGPDGTVYVGSDDGKLYALTAAGALRFSITTLDVVRSSPAVSPDGTIYVGSDDWSLTAVLPSGVVKWTFIAAGPVTSSPAIGADGTVYVGSYDGYLYALHPGTGAVQWWYETFDAITSSPAIAPDGSIVFGNDDGVVRAVHPDGSLKWSASTGGAVLSSPAIDEGGVVFVGSADNSVYALDPDDGSVLFSLPTGGDIIGSAAIRRGLIYIGSYDQKLYAVGSPCSSMPCGNGHGPCTDNADCAEGLVCGYGIAHLYGLSEEVGVCWDPTSCATLQPSDCGSPGSLCPSCCLPQCDGSGGSDGCGGTCQACVPGADSDGDGLLDCDERGDHDGWTDPLVWNGVLAERGASCHPTPSCPVIDSIQEIDACFAPLEESRLRAGWDFATIDRNVCDPAFGFEPAWQGCSEDFAVRYRASVRLAESGVHCFAISGGIVAQCGALFIDGGSPGLNSPGGLGCFELSAGVYPIEWFYETTSTATNELHVDYCFGGGASCTPSAPLPADALRPPADAEERVCAPDAPCSELCPCSSGGLCTSDLHCEARFDCRFDRADRFGLPAGTGVCWDGGICDDWRSALFECGTANAYCGPECPVCTPDCSGRSCGYDGCWGSCGNSCAEGESGCESDADCSAGLTCVLSDSGPNICRPERCAHPALNPCSDPANGGQTTECGVCPVCVPDCAGKQCGDDGCGGSCGEPGEGEFCTPEGHVRPGDVVATILPLVTVPDLPSEADTAGTLPGALEVTDYGQASYRIPLQVPPGRNGIEPKLALTYSSAGGDGYLGMGWGLSGLSAIQRCPKTMAHGGEPAGRVDADRVQLETGTRNGPQTDAHHPAPPAGVRLDDQAAKPTDLRAPRRLAGVRGAGAVRRPDQRLVALRLAGSIEGSGADSQLKLRLQRGLRRRVRIEVALQLGHPRLAHLRPTAQVILIGVVRRLQTFESAHLCGRLRVLQEQRVPGRQRLDSSYERAASPTSPSSWRTSLDGRMSWPIKAAFRATVCQRYASNEPSVT